MNQVNNFSTNYAILEINIQSVSHTHAHARTHTHTHKHTHTHTHIYIYIYNYNIHYFLKYPLCTKFKNSVEQLKSSCTDKHNNKNLRIISK